jgi:hypothetical protein
MTTYGPLLKRVYRDGVSAQINREVKLYDWFFKNSKDWVGNQLFYAVRTADANTATNIGDNGTFPVAGDTTDRNLVVTAQTIADRIQISTKLMKSAKKGAGSFLNVVDDKVNQLIKEVKTLADRRMFDGNITKGLINEQKGTIANTNVAAPYVGGGASGAAAALVWEYSGDLNAATSPFRAVVAANTNTWVRVNLRQMDTYALIVPTFAGGGVAATTGLFVSNFNRANMTVSLSLVSNGIGTWFTTIGVGAGFACALELHPTQLQDGLGNNFGTVVPFVLEQSGILTNLCSGTHWTVDRTSATGQASLQSSIFTQVAVVPQARAALTGVRMQSVLDAVNDLTGSDPTLFIMNARMRARYQAIFVQTHVVDGAETKVDAGSSGFSFNGVEIKTAQHIPLGMIMFLTPDSFEVAAYDDGEWMETGGDMFHPVANTAAQEACYTWDWDLVCEFPNKNGILCGMTIA